MADPVTDPLAPYADTINAAAQEWGHDPDMLRALIMQESSGNTGAVSKAGARGMTGLMPATAAGVGVTDLKDPTQQIFGAAKYLAQGRDAEGGSPEGALLYYHGGPDWRKAYGPESQGYVPAIAGRYSKLKAGAGSDSGAVPSDADFLASTKPAASSESTVPSDADFLASTGAAPAPQAQATDQPDTHWSDGGGNEYGITGDPQQFNNTKGVEVAQPVANVAGAALSGAKAGFGSGPLGLSDAQRAVLQKAGVINAPGQTGPLRSINEAGINALAAGGDFLLRGGNALLGAYQGGIAQAGEEIGAPRLGRDLAALPEAFPTGDTGGGLRLPGPTGPAAGGETRLATISQAAHDRLDAPLPAQFLDNPLTAQARAKLQAQEAERMAPSPGMGPVPNAAGAQASTTAQASLTPQEIAAYRATAEGSKLIEPQPIGVPDRNPYVQGVNPNLAEQEQTVNTARELKLLNMSAPAVSQEAKETAAIHSEARGAAFDAASGSPVDVMNATNARTEQLNRDYPAAFAGAKPADPLPIATAAQELLDAPRGLQNTQLQSYVKPLINRLMNEDGTPKITNPEELYGFREDVARMTSKASQSDQPNLIHVGGQLNDLLGVIDQQIEAAAPGYRQYMDNYAEASRGIDEMQVLQNHRNGLYNRQSQMTYGNFQGMMKNIVDSRAAPGLNQYKSITDDTMQKLWAIRDDLRRSASAQELARTPGSDSAQNFMDIIKGVGKSGANMAIHGAIMAHTGPVGNLLYQAVKGGMTHRSEERAAAKQMARGMQMLHPDPSNLRNRLAEP